MHNGTKENLLLRLISLPLCPVTQVPLYLTPSHPQVWFNYPHL